jgi:hypothetical protein
MGQEGLYTNDQPVSLAALVKRKKQTVLKENK